MRFILYNRFSFVLIHWGVSHKNLYKLFNAKSSLYIYINYIQFINAFLDSIFKQPRG